MSKKKRTEDDDVLYFGVYYMGKRRVLLVLLSVYIDVSWLKIDLRDIGCGSVD
jgi:hypothetical protein